MRPQTSRHISRRLNSTSSAIARARPRGNVTRTPPTDPSRPGRRHQPQPPVILGRWLRAYHARFRGCGNLHRRKTGPELLNRSRLPTPGEHHARRDTVAAGNVRHLGARYQRFLDNTCLVVCDQRRRRSNPSKTSTRIAR
jgi:hypothetical protein